MIVFICLCFVCFDQLDSITVRGPNEFQMIVAKFWFDVNRAIVQTDCERNNEIITKTYFSSHWNIVVIGSVWVSSIFQICAVRVCLWIFWWNPFDLEKSMCIKSHWVAVSHLFFFICYLMLLTEISNIW